MLADCATLFNVLIKNAPIEEKRVMIVFKIAIESLKGWKTRYSVDEKNV